MTTERTQVGQEVETALGEVLAHVRGEVDLPCRIVDDPAAEHIRALRKRMQLSRQKFADRFGLDVLPSVLAYTDSCTNAIDGPPRAEALSRAVIIASDRRCCMNTGCGGCGWSGVGY